MVTNKGGTAGFTVWLTGLSGAGKTTIAIALATELRARERRVEILDGDVVRTNLSQGLGFTREDRDINVRRIGWVCELLTRNEVIAIAAAISPYRGIRDEVRARIGRFVEVYVEAPLEVLAKRDVKGLYAKADSGELSGLSGVDDPYEAPHDPDVVCSTGGGETVEQNVMKVLAKLEALDYLPSTPANSDEAYTADEESEVTDRLRDLGYL